jgi:hypothetical protein
MATEAETSHQEAIPAPEASAPSAAPATSPGPVPERLLAWQRSAGNAAVSRYLRPSAAARTAGRPLADRRSNGTTASASAASDVQLQRAIAARAEPSSAPSPSPASAPGPAHAPGAVDPARRFIADYARRVPGYSLVAHAIGADPITGEPVQGSLVAEVVGLIPGGAALMQRLQQSGALERASAWLTDEVSKLELTYERIAQLFERAWDNLSAWDLIDPGAAWDRLARIFDPPIARVRAFAERAAEKLFEFSLEAMLAAGGGAAEQVMGVAATRRPGVRRDRP